jgi:hypothetical protein
VRIGEPNTEATRTYVAQTLPAIGGVGIASPFVLYEPVQVVSAAAAEREPGCSPGESTMIEPCRSDL